MDGGKSGSVAPIETKLESRSGAFDRWESKESPPSGSDGGGVEVCVRPVTGAESGNVGRSLRSVSGNSGGSVRAVLAPDPGSDGGADHCGDVDGTCNRGEPTAEASRDGSPLPRRESTPMSGI
jgi:hypothetical protein